MAALKITLCENPFDLTRDRRLLEPGKTIGEVLEREQLDTRYTVVCNGELLPPERALEYAPRESDDVHLVPVLGNSTLRTIAAIGVSIAAAYFTAGLGNIIGGPALFGSLTTASQNAIAGAILSIGGSLAIAGVSSLFTKAPGGSSYGVLGPTTTARSGIPIPKGYGTFRAAGNIVESWIDIQGDNGDLHDVDDGADRIGRQYINCRVDFGWGPAAAINNLQLNGKDISSYADVAYVLRLGTNDQTAVTAADTGWTVLNRTVTGTTTNNQPTTGFDTVNNNYPQNQRVRAGIETNFVIVRGQRADTEKLTVYVVFPRGCWRTDDTMQQKRLTIYYDVYYRVAGSGDTGWVLAQHHEYTNIQTTILRQATIVDGLAPGRYDVKIVKLGSGAYQNPMDSFEHESNKFGDQLWVESVQETSYTTLAYPNSIQVCLRFMATDQLSGSDVNLTADIDFLPRSTMPDELADLDPDNPAVVAYDILHDDVIGAGMPDERIDLDWLRAMAELSDSMVDDGDGSTQRLCRFHGIFDQPNTNIWQALLSVCTLARSHPQRIGRRVTGWIDQPDVPVQMFHVGNTLIDSYEKTWLNQEDRAQELSVTFADRADDYKTRNPVRIVTAANETSQDELKKTNLNLLGCDDRVQAYYWGLLQLHHAQNSLRTHKWQSNRNAIRCRSGNIVLLQTDSPNAAWGGLVEPGSSAAVLRLDRLDLPFEAGTNYSVVVQLPAVKRLTCVVQAVSGNVVALAGYDGSTLVNRVVIPVSGSAAVIDAGIDSIAPGSNGLYLFTLEDASGFPRGSAVELWMTDPLLTIAVAAVRRITNDDTGHACTEVTLATPLPVNPQDWCSYIYQSTARVAIPVRITGIMKRLGEQRYTLFAKDYSPDSYTLPAPISGQSYVQPPTSPPPIGNPGAAAQAVLSVAYTVNQDGTYSVTGIAVQSQGSGYTSSSSAVLVSDYVQPQPSGPDLTDPTQTLQLTLNSSGSITAATGFDSKTSWHDLPYVNLTR